MRKTKSILLNLVTIQWLAAFSGVMVLGLTESQPGTPGAVLDAVIHCGVLLIVFVGFFATRIRLSMRDVIFAFCSALTLGVAIGGIGSSPREMLLFAICGAIWYLVVLGITVWVYLKSDRKTLVVRPSELR